MHYYYPNAIHNKHGRSVIESAGLRSAIINRGCLIAVASVVSILTVLIATAIFVNENLTNPEYHGKRVNSWADQAIHDRSPAARRDAAQRLAEVFPQMDFGRSQLLMRFCYAQPELSEEVIPFLRVALHAKEMESGGYPAIAFSQVEPNAAIPALIEIVVNDDDSHARAGAVAALGLMGRKARAAEPALRQALLNDPSDEVRHRAAEALKAINGSEGNVTL